MRSLSPATAAPATVRERVVGMAELAVSAESHERLVTFAVGAALAIAVFDPGRRVGGLLHAILPSSDLDPGLALREPARFVDSGVPVLFRAVYQRGGRKDHLVVHVVGGSRGRGVDDEDQDDLGDRNVVACTRLLARNRVRIAGEHTGGQGVSRTLSLDIASGEVALTVNGRRVPF